MAQTWDPQAYARDGAFVHGLAEGVLEWLAAQPGERILDLGCGDGQLTARLAAGGVDVGGVDASAAMVAAARARGIIADEASAENLPYADAAFDAVFSNAVLHWVGAQVLEQRHAVHVVEGQLAGLHAMKQIAPRAPVMVVGCHDGEAAQRARDIAA